MRTVQMVLSMGTSAPDLRSEVHGWGSEDPRLYQPGKPIGLTPGTYKSPDCPKHYGTVLEALADGWKLLGPPTDAPIVNADGQAFPQYDWWLVKDVDADADAELMELMRYAIIINADAGEREERACRRKHRKKG